MYPSHEQKIKKAKILLRQTSSDLKATYDEDGYYPQNSVFIITSSKFHLKYLLALLNSKLIDYIYKSKSPQSGKVFAEVKPGVIKSLPIPAITMEQQAPFVTMADTMLLKNKELFGHKLDFILFMQSKWPGLLRTGKISDWPSLSFDMLIRELEKQKINLSLNEQSEWLHYFTEQKIKQEAFRSEITHTDTLINKMVYELYHLNDEEKKILNLK